MEPFIQIPVEQWCLLQEKLKVMWPFNLAGFYALQQNLKYPKLREAFQFKVYSPFGNIENGFVATTVKGDLDLIIFSINEDTKRLEEALLQTKLIDWTKKICIDLISSMTLNLLEKRVIPSLNLSQYKIGKVRTYVLDRNTKPFILKCPTGTYLASIDGSKQDHLRIIDESWPYQFDGSLFYFTHLAKSELGVGLYSSNGHQLLAWVFLNEYNFLLHLYCKEEHRRKGYAEYLLKSVTNDQLMQGNDVYTYVEEKNVVSSSLFEKIGFVNVDDGAYIYTS